MPSSYTHNARAGIENYEYSSVGGALSLYFTGPDRYIYQPEITGQITGLIIPDSVKLGLVTEYPKRLIFEASYDELNAERLYHTLRDLKFNLSRRPVMAVKTGIYL